LILKEISYADAEEVDQQEPEKHQEGCGWWQGRSHAVVRKVCDGDEANEPDHSAPDRQIEPEAFFELRYWAALSKPAVDPVRSSSFSNSRTTGSDQPLA
jgi:hypothetical protein